jgi:hypothetical protein
MNTFSIGATIKRKVGEMFFSERSAIKLALGLGVDKGAGSKGALKRVILSEEEASGLVIEPQNLILPNTVEEGTFEGGEKLQVRACLLQGSLSIPSGTTFPNPPAPDEFIDSDVYRFAFKQGDFVTAEAISFSTIGDLITKVRIVHPSTGEVLCDSLQEFEAYDGLCFDVEIPEDGIYEVRIETTDIFCNTYFPATTGPYLKCGLLSLCDGCLEYLEGKYDFFVYTTNKALGKPQ